MKWAIRDHEDGHLWAWRFLKRSNAIAKLKLVRKLNPKDKFSLVCLMTRSEKVIREMEREIGSSPWTPGEHCAVTSTRYWLGQLKGEKP